MSTAMETLKYLNNLSMFGKQKLEDKKSMFYSVSGESTSLIMEHGDIYEMLENPVASAIAIASDSVVVSTCGWASPNNAGEQFIPPSQHSERRRVSLLICANSTETASVIRFSDDWENPVYDEGEAVGILADAVKMLFA